MPERRIRAIAINPKLAAAGLILVLSVSSCQSAAGATFCPEGTRQWKFTLDVDSIGGAQQACYTTQFASFDSDGDFSQSEDEAFHCSDNLERGVSYRGEPDEATPRSLDWTVRTHAELPDGTPSRLLEGTIDFDCDNPQHAVVTVNADNSSTIEFGPLP